jgi:malate dehydrogenase
MGIPSEGSYGIPEGVIFGFPVTCSGGSYEIVQGLDLNDFSKARLDVTVNELEDERETVKQLDLI